MIKRKGFTMIEAIICTAILGIISCICLPVFGGIYYKNQAVSLETSSKELLADLRLMQQKAITEGYTYHIYFNKVENSYMIYKYENMNNCIYKHRRLPKEIFYDAIKSTYINNKISFNSNGKPIPFPCTVALRNAAGDYKRITITVGTDYISLKDK